MAKVTHARFQPFYELFSNIIDIMHINTTEERVLVFSNSIEFSYGTLINNYEKQLINIILEC